MSSTPATSPEQVLAKKCLDIVEAFRRSIISKSVACIDLTHLIELEADDSTPEGIALIAAPYLSMLDQWQEEINRAARAPGVAAATRDQPESSETGDYQGIPTREIGNESDSGDEGGQPTRKRCKLDIFERSTRDGRKKDRNESITNVLPG
ncbi:hypothetical protein AZE42_11285 [Rhizopogon vesiculosus]|uniref:Uncharacterized protein n=1 Tax=Rhizopogon vesiculosus TaxID=180088 RepID=A0A1J8Q7U2_9AGAM|nr:hypothetical protein AZE42_11285 [Rhizopogon vesiculosus]